MTITINGSGTIGGLSAGGLPDATVQPADLSTGAPYWDTSGNVGIGTSSPSYKLDVSGSIRGDTFVRATSGSVGSYLVANSGGGFGVVGTATNHPFLLNTNDTERARIDTSGNLLVGGTTQTNGAKIEAFYNGGSLNGFVANDTASASGTTYFVCSNNGTLIGNIARVGTTSSVAYNTSSDYRLKENIQPMVGALDKVKELKPCTYTWKEDGSSGQGFIAHELQAVVPDCVHGEKDAVDADGNPVYQGIDTSFLVATLTAAIQEQQAMIASQSAIITQLQADVEALKGQA